MKSHILTRNTIIKKNIDEVFKFFSKAENLNQITPPLLGFKIINSPEEMKKGSLIDYKIKLNGITFNWQTEITKWDPPYYFEDTQIKGPYKMWVHEHKFEEKDEITFMTDIVNYLSPGGIFEFIPHKLIVKKKVESIFDYREKSLKKIFG
ncbi:MAG: SRPBCC family protein [Bacteroidota bacterium]|nr:SRPBCC family protein [Bacteroidota bacterium]